MGDMASDIIALHDMIEQNERELRTKQPEHELVRFANMLDADGKLTGKLNEEFVKRFAPAEGTKVIHMWCNYHIALEEALGKRLPVVTPPPTKNLTPPPVESGGVDEIPF